MSTPGDQLATNPDQRLIAGIAYGLYGLALCGLFLPLIPAVILNYLKVDDSLPLYASHHRWMIRTLWWGVGWFIVGGVLSMILVGFLVLFIVWVWWFYRLIRGFLALMENRPPVSGSVFPK